MNLQVYAFYLILSLIKLIEITSAATKNITPNTSVTTRNEYLFKHILISPILNNSSNEINEIIRQEVKVDNVNIESIKNDSSLEQQKKLKSEPLKEYNVNEPNETLDDYEDLEGYLSRQKTFIDYYHEGVTAYLANDYLSCISLFERAVVLYQDYYNTLSYCRVSCDMERKLMKPAFKEDYEHHHFFEGILHKTLCLEKCRREHLRNVSKFFNIDFEDKIVFKSRKPYNYLQICYYRDKEIKKAINAAYTAMVGNREDEMLQKNIKYYSTLKEFDYENINDLEDKEYSKYYLQGRIDYTNKNWTATIENFEKFIHHWVQEYDKCRAFCEDDFHQGWLPDFTTALANHYVYVLRCKQNCTADLLNVNGRLYGDILVNAYDYLQYSYYQAGEIRKGANCIASYLLFYPDSFDMLDSYRYYDALPNVTKDYFQPRDEAKRIDAIRKYEDNMLNFVDKEFTKLLISEDTTFRRSSLQGDLSESENVQDETKTIRNVKQNEIDINFQGIIKNFFKNWKKEGKV